VLIKEGEILMQKGQLSELQGICRVLDEANKVMCEVISKCARDQMRHPEEAGYELTREDIESVNECQDRILEATGKKKPPIKWAAKKRKWLTKPLPVNSRAQTSLS